MLTRPSILIRLSKFLLSFTSFSRASSTESPRQYNVILSVDAHHLCTLVSVSHLTCRLIDDTRSSEQLIQVQLKRLHTTKLQSADYELI